MANINSLTSIFALLLIIQTAKISESWLTECRVYNQEFLMYIYAKYKLLGLGSTRTILPYRTFLDDFYYIFNRNEIKFEYSEEDPSAIWLFEPVDGRKNTFYLRNKKYIDEYLRGSYDELSHWYDYDFSIWASKKHQVDDDELYMWGFDRIDDTNQTNLYYIWNVKLGLPLYTRKYHFIRGSKVSVSLKNGASYDSEEFEWVLKCLDDLLPVVYN